MAKIIAIGDLHGQHQWQEIIKKEKTFDKVVFAGDYFDNPNVRAVEQIHNFNEVIHFKETDPDRVICLMGNHEQHYLRGGHKKYAGFDPVFFWQVQEALHRAIDSDLIQMAHECGQYLFTHAGVTKTWCRNNDIDMGACVSAQINDLFRYRPRYFDFTPGDCYDEYGDEVCQTPIWVRPASMLKDGLENYMHIVGHTRHDEITIHNGKAAFIDVLHARQYLVINTDNNSLIVRAF